jgi:hypothetical protein
MLMCLSSSLRPYTRSPPPRLRLWIFIHLPVYRLLSLKLMKVKHSQLSTLSVRLLFLSFSSSPRRPWFHIYVFPPSVLWPGVINLIQFTGINQPNMILPSPPLLGRLFWGVDGTTLVAHNTERRNTKETKQTKNRKDLHTHSNFGGLCLSDGGIPSTVECQIYCCFLQLVFVTLPLVCVTLQPGLVTLQPDLSFLPFSTFLPFVLHFLHFPPILHINYHSVRFWIHNTYQLPHCGVLNP